MTMFPSPPVPSSHESEPSRFTGFQPGRFGKVLLGAAVVVVLGLGVWEVVDTVTDDDLEFSYAARSGDDFADQQLLIRNGRGVPVAPILRFTALNGDGDTLPGVTVTTVCGSDRGSLVVLPHGSSDVLIFGGPLADQVADVEVTVDDAPAVDFPSVDSAVEITAFDDEGLSTTGYSRISGVKVTNTNGLPVTVRLVYIVWTDPETGTAQQAETVTPVGDLITVPADGSVTVPMTGPADAANAAAVAGDRAAGVEACYSAAAGG
ncbi:hypothetical protein [Actinoplanes sp. NPDC026623]|uniref:hypothetical protein n=1 Tax=Actinoplanes sp. NPDC026623 TaxID=3155610 RepID=UPI0033D4BA5F